MKYNRVGRAGVKVSALSLGSWLTYGTDIGDKDSKSIIDAAYDAGINSFDTANAYNSGAAEEVLGRALKGRKRDSLVIATKAYFSMGEGPNDSGLSRKHITEQVHASLKRLDMDYVDIFYCHRYDENTPIEETVRAIDDLIRQGKILYAGVSEWTAKQISEALAAEERYLLDRIVVNQPSFNLLNRYIEKEVLPFCREKGIGQIVYSPLAQGLLTGKYKRNQPAPAGSRGADKNLGQFLHSEYMAFDRNFDKLEAIEKVSAEAGIPMNHLALAWILSVPGISSAIVGASRLEQLLDNLKAVDVCLAPDVLEALDQASPVE